MSSSRFDLHFIHLSLVVSQDISGYLIEQMVYKLEDQLQELLVFRFLFVVAFVSKVPLSTAVLCLNINTTE